VTFELVEYLRLGASGDALGVQIVDPEQPSAAVPAGLQIAGKRRQERTQMQRAGGRGGEAAAVSRFDQSVLFLGWPTAGAETRWHR